MEKKSPVLNAKTNIDIKVAQLMKKIIPHLLALLLKANNDINFFTTCTENGHHNIKNKKYSITI